MNSLLLLRDQKTTHDSSHLSLFGGSEEKTGNRSDQIQIYPSSPDFTVSPSAYFATYSLNICSMCYELIPFLVVLKKIHLCAFLQGCELQLPVHASHTHSPESVPKCYKWHGITLRVSGDPCNFVKCHSYYGMLHSRIFFSVNWQCQMPTSKQISWNWVTYTKK